VSSNVNGPGTHKEKVLRKFSLDLASLLSQRNASLIETSCVVLRWLASKLK
jgi:hypothetical protein